MRFRDKIRFVKQNIKKNKSRMFMTVLATAMGSCFLISLSSVGYGFQKSLTDEITSRATVTEISLYPRVEKDSTEEKPITLDEIESLKSIENVKSVVRHNYSPVKTNFMIGDYQTENVPIFTHFESEEKAGLELSEGRYPANQNEIIVGYDFAKGLQTKEETPKSYSGNILNTKIKAEFSPFEGEKPNDSVQGKTMEFTIVGLTKDHAKEWVEDQKVYLNEELYESVLTDLVPSDFSLKGFQEIYVYADDMSNVQGIVDVLDEKYMTYSVVSELKEINMVFGFIKFGLLFVGAIAVLIAAIGISNTMHMSVQERTQDIGIMKALGASPSAIKNIFLLESSYIGILGTVIGTIVAYGISYAVNFGVPLIVKNQMDTGDFQFTFSYISPMLVFVAAVISIGVAIMSGLRPAKRATDIDVLRALRRDI